ncbi:MAG: hypothetical protein WCS32_02480 [Candidatus Izemoplasmatales bacterium]
MKKIFLLFTLLGIFTCTNIVVKAEDYQNYQEIVFDDSDAKLLKDFSSKDYKTLYKKVAKRKFSGWNIYVVNKNEPVEFVSETKIKIYNNGYTPIKQDIKLKTKEETNLQLSASGSIKVDLSGNIKKFKGGIDANIKASVSYSKLTTNEETYEFEIIVDPMTYVKILTRGTGEINNGVGKSYFFWITTKSGGWEIFTIKTEYYEIFKERI